MIDSETEHEIRRKKSGQARRTERETATVGTPANLIMTGCELDSLTDGPGARLQGASASSEGKKRWGEEEQNRGSEGEDEARRQRGEVSTAAVTIQINSVPNLRWRSVLGADSLREKYYTVFFLIHVTCDIM